MVLEYMMENADFVEMAVKFKTAEEGEKVYE